MRETYEDVQTIVADTAKEIGLTINTKNIFTSSDTDAKQLAQFVIATCEELLTKYPWRSYIGTDPWVEDANGGFKYKLENDSDTPLIDSRTLKLGTRWRWLHNKGLTYNEDFRTYQLRINSFAYDKNKTRDIDMNEEIR